MNLIESIKNISMYVGIIFTIANMLKNNDFSSQPEITLIIGVSFVIFMISNLISYKLMIGKIKNNKDDFIKVYN